MPELPEVETVVNDLRQQGLAGRLVTGADVLNPRTVEPDSPAAFSQRIANRRIANLTRRGKYIVLWFEDGEALLIHLRMTGRLHFTPLAQEPEPHVRLRLRLDDGRALVFHDTRRFGRCRLVPDAEQALAHLGSEPLSKQFTPTALRAVLASRRRKLKPLLLDQTVVAGLGNIYVDEALWEARLHPEQTSESVSRKGAENLHTAIQTVLRRGIAAQGTTLGAGRDNFYSVAGRRGSNVENLRVFRRDGLPCPRCGTTIERTVVGQRGTHHCPRCQKARGEGAVQPSAKAKAPPSEKSKANARCESV